MDAVKWFLYIDVLFLGIATKVSLVRPKVVTSVHYCPTTSKSTERHYSDLTSLEAYPTSAAYPTQDDDGNPLQTEYGLSTYKDHQTLTLQELPEKAPTGQLPRCVDVILENDLVDSCKPGDRVQIIASFRALPGKQGGYTTGTFRTILLANNVVQKGMLFLFLYYNFAFMYVPGQLPLSLPLEYIVMGVYFIIIKLSWCLLVSIFEVIF